MNNITFVDLGLPSGTLWASRNIGAHSQGNSGIYISKPVTFHHNGYKIPTKEQFEELRHECKWKWTTKNYKYGYKVIGKNGKSIFLPATGFYCGDSLYQNGRLGYYLSSTPYGGNSYTYYLHFDSLCVHVNDYSNQCVGMALRLVYNKSEYE